MNNKEIKKHLQDMFVPRDNNMDGVAFRMEYMQKESPAYFIYQAVSDAQRESGLSFNFAYEIANRAVDIICDLEEDELEDYSDAVSDAVDAAVPVYTYELMEIYKADGATVDEAVKELGTSADATSEDRARIGWYYAIENMTRAILRNLIDRN